MNISLTPDKSLVSTIVKGKSISQKIVFINKKGTFLYRAQCMACVFKGRVQAGLGYYIEPTCDRDRETWRRENGRTQKTCKYFKDC